jgi:aryl-alcohol dehydrogenase (NADP+)
VDKVLAVAERRGVPAAQVALAWLLAQPAVTSPIVGATRPEHLDDAIAAVDLTLSADELDELTADYVPHAVAGHR